MRPGPFSRDDPRARRDAKAKGPTGTAINFREIAESPKQIVLRRGRFRDEFARFYELVLVICSACKRYKFIRLSFMIVPRKRRVSSGFRMETILNAEKEDLLQYANASGSLEQPFSRYYGSELIGETQVRPSKSSPVGL